MSLLASSLAGANYMTSNNEDRESATNGAAEFTRRKKWPEILLKELVGGSIFCLKPVLIRRGSGQQGGGSGSGGGTTWIWKIIYSSPAVIEMLGKKPAELEGKDFLDLVFTADHGQIQTFFHHLLTPSLPHHSSSSSTTMSVSSASQQNNPHNIPNTLGDSQTTYVRMLSSSTSSSGGSNDNSPESSSNGTGSGSNDTPSSSNKKIGPVIWEIRAHASGLGDDIPIPLPPGTENLTMAGTNGTLNTNNQGEGGNGMKGKAIWVMGRRVSENVGEGEMNLNGNGGNGSALNGGNGGNGNGNGGGSGSNQNLDAFLELKLENERLREELRELQLDLDEDLPSRKSSNPNISPTKQTTFVPSSSPSSEDSSPSSSRSSSPSKAATKSKGKTGRPPKEGKDKDKEKEKKRKKSSAGAGGKEGEGMHVCVTCGRTDSPEWRKGPLGPKTLCNACGLRWAKRNSNQPTRKDRKPNDGKK